MTENIRALSNAFSQSPPNELEKRLAEQAKPGWLPEGSLRTYALDATLKALAITDPAKYARIKAAQINNEGVDIINSILRGEA